MEKFYNFNAESIVSERLPVDSSVTVEHFYSFTTVPFMKRTYCRDERSVFTQQSSSIKSNDVLES